MGILRDRMEADLQIGGYSDLTRYAYLRHAKQYAAYHGRSPEEMGANEVREFLLHLVADKQLSRESVRVARAALMFLYRVTLRRPVEVEWLPVPRREKRTPVVLSGSEVTALLKAVRRPKYHAMLTAMYAAGLRLSEARTLRPENIDSKRMIITVRGKGNKERCTLLSQRLLTSLRDYWRVARPSNGWLFPGRSPSGVLARESVRRALHQAAQAAGITKAVTTHLLRHYADSWIMPCPLLGTGGPSLRRPIS